MAWVASVAGVDHQEDLQEDHQEVEEATLGMNSPGEGFLRTQFQ